MIKVYFLTGWGESPSDTLKRYSVQTPNCSGVWGGICGTDNFNEADYYIVLEGTNISTPTHKTIYIKREPDFIQPLEELPYKHIIDFEVTNGGVTYWLGKTYDELKALKYPSKTKLVSCIVSNKHKRRREYVHRLFKKQSGFDPRRLFNKNIKIDLYGRGHDDGYFGESYKGELNYNGLCKFNGLVDYSYSIVIENSVQRNYWTEKIADAYLSWCFPIYWGCPNIGDYFPEGSYKTIDINSKNPMHDIKRIVSEPITNAKISLLEQSRSLILDKYNIWEVIDGKIKKIEALR